MKRADQQSARSHSSGLSFEFEEQIRVADTPQHVVDWRQSREYLAAFGRELLQMRFGDFQVRRRELLHRRIKRIVVKVRKPQRLILVGGV